MPNDPSIKCQGLYQSLKKQGYSKVEAARISNGLWRKGECTGKRKEKNMSELFITKDRKTGKRRWIAVTSSAYLDRDKEIVTEDALIQAVAEMDESKEYGDLLWGHIEGAKLGTTDFSMVYAHQLIESGTFVNEAIGEAIDKVARQLGLSIGFKHPPTEPKEGQYEVIRIKERSALLRGKESNLFTRLGVTGGAMSTKARLEEKRGELVTLLGDDLAAQVFADADTKAKSADEAGWVRKEAKRKSWWQNVKEALGAIPDPDDEEGELELDDDTDEVEAVAAEKKEAKPVKKSEDGDGDDMPITRGEFKASMAKWEEKMAGLLGERQKETDTLATKEEVARVAAAVTPVVTIQKETVERLGQVEKQVQTLTGETLPRGMAGFFRASVEGSAATEKAAQEAEKLKAQQKRDPLDVMLDERLGA